MSLESQGTGENKSGFFSGLFAYLLWGIFPIYFKILEHIPAFEVLLHRIVWSVPFTLIIIFLRRQWRDVVRILKSVKTLILLTCSAIALSINWLVYIWAIQIDQIFQGSLGYYINPLLYVLVGVLFFKETLSRLQTLAVGLATLGVLALTVYGGQIPLISLCLAISFTTYGVIRKYVDVGALPGLFVETLIVFTPAFACMVWLNYTGEFKFEAETLNYKLWLLAAGPITVIPLVAFAFAARRITLAMLGFLQFIAPTLQFICGLFYGEAFSTAHAICFGLVWGAVVIFSWDSFSNSKASKLGV